MCITNIFLCTEIFHKINFMSKSSDKEENYEKLTYGKDKM